MNPARLTSFANNYFHGLRTFGVAIAFASVCLSGASAATVNFILDLSVDNQWKVFADVSDGDNFGIASYSFQFTGQTLTHDNLSPRTTNANTGSPAGFTLLRTADNTNAGTTENNQTISASQDTVGLIPNPDLVYGYGQEASSFVLKGMTPSGVPATNEQLVWGEPLLLAQGTYNRLLNPGLTINMASATTFVNVFTQPDNPNDEVNPPTAQIPNANESLFRGCFLCNPPIVNDHVVGLPYNANEPGEPQTLTHQFTATYTGAQNELTWDQLQLVSYTPNYGGQPPGPHIAPTLSPTGQFSWVSEGSPRGDYVWSVRARTPGGLSDTGTIMVHTTHVPEPSTIALFGLAIVGLAGSRRRNL